MIIGLLHPGNMGASVGGRLRRAGHNVLWAPANRSASTRERAEAAGLIPTEFDDLIRQAELLISICPSAAAAGIAETVAEHRYRGIFIDANAISPSQMRRIGHLATDAGATVIDAVISGPPPDDSASPKIFIAGPSDESSLVQQVFEKADFAADVLSETPGTASALKMALISYQRSARLLTALAHGIADDHDVTNALIGEATRTGNLALADRDGLSGIAARAWRWIPELQEVTRTLEESDLPADLASTSSLLYELLASEKDNWTISPDRVIERLRQTQDT